jgi:phospholipase/carboxylesterase
MTVEFDGIEREIGARVDLGIIWLHGLGADASDFVPIVGELDLPTGARFVFPNAPLRPVTINGGLVMRAWYDIFGFGPDAPEDTEGLAASAGHIGRLIERELERGLEPGRIVLAGFSQGGAVALHAGLGTPGRIGGIVGLSTYLPAPEQLAAKGALATDVPVWLGHGTHDPVIPLALAERSAQALLALGLSVEWSTYPMGHELMPAEIAAISVWLRRFRSP